MHFNIFQIITYLKIIEIISSFNLIGINNTELQFCLMIFLYINTY